MSFRLKRLDQLGLEFACGHTFTIRCKSSIYVMNSSSEVDVFSLLLGFDQLPEEEYLLFSTAVAVNVLHLIA